jgi:hypothetical protein
MFGHISSIPKAAISLIRDWMTIYDKSHDKCHKASSDMHPAGLIEVVDF